MSQANVNLIRAVYDAVKLEGRTALPRFLDPEVVWEVADAEGTVGRGAEAAVVERSSMGAGTVLRVG